MSSLEGSDSGEVVDVHGGASAGEVVDSTVKTLQDRTDGGSTTDALCDLVGDVAHLEVGEDKDIGVTGHLTTGSLELSDGGIEGGIDLELAVDLQLGSDLAGVLHSLDHEVDLLVLGTALGGEGGEGDLGIHTEDRLCCLGRGDGDLSELLLIRRDHDAAVGKDEESVGAVLRRDLVIHLDDEAAAHSLDTGGGAKDLQGGADGVAGGVDRTGYLAIGIATLDHQAADEERVLSLGECLLGSHALMLA